MERRDFLKASAIGAAGIMMPAGMIHAANSPLPASKKKESANGKVNLGFIGLGQQAMYLLKGFISMDDVRVVAGCDVYDVKRDRFVKRVTDYYTGKGEKKVKVDVYEDYQDVLARPDIDAVVIAVPDHQHAIIAKNLLMRPTLPAKESSARSTRSKSMSDATMSIPILRLRLHANFRRWRFPPV